MSAVLDRSAALAARFWLATEGWGALLFLAFVLLTGFAAKAADVTTAQLSLLAIELITIPIAWLAARGRAQSSEWHRSEEAAYRFFAFNILDVVLVLLLGLWFFPLSLPLRALTTAWLYILLRPMLWQRGEDDESHDSWASMWLRVHLSRWLHVDD